MLLLVFIILDLTGLLVIGEAKTKSLNEKDKVKEEIPTLLTL